MSSPCVFCNLVAERWSEEHVIPKWLLNHLEITAQDQMFQGFSDPNAKETTKPRIHASWRLVEGRVCTACNSGWMSRFEDAVRPVLVDLIGQRRSLWELTAQESALVARWVVKTAYLLANV